MVIHIQLGYEPYRIDFEECFERRIEGDLDDTKVNFLSLNDLILSKKSTGRRQDLADAENLEKIKRENL